MIRILNDKTFHAVIFFILSILFFIFVFLPSVKKINTDFPNYYVSSNMYLDGKDLMDAYDNVEFNKQVLLYGIENQIVSFVPYPPLNALLVIPFARLEPLSAKLFWNVLNLIFFLLSAYLISKISNLNFFLTGILFFVSGYAFVNNFFFGQVYLLVLVCFISSIYFLMKEKDILSALLFSLSVMLKFYTIFFLILFLLKKKYRIFFLSVFFIVILNVFAFVITGWELNFFYYSKIMPRISDGWVGTVYAPEFQSAISLLHILFYSESSLNPTPLIESPQLYFIFKYFFYFGILAVSIFIVWYSRRNDNAAIFKLQISLFCFVCMLLLPVNASYQYVILIPAIAILVNHYITEKKYFKIGVTLILFFIMNSPLVPFMINHTKNSPYFFLGYIKLFILIYFWINLVVILKSFTYESISKSSIINYTIVTLLLILIFSKMSLSINNENSDEAKNVLINPNYLISMPSYHKDKIIFTECQNNKFILNSNFGLIYDKENIFAPEFLNENEIIYETFRDKEKIFKKLNLINLKDTVITNSSGLRDSLNHTRIKCLSENGQIYLDYGGKLLQITFGNSNNTRPVLSEDKSKIIFCSDRKRGVGFTTLYEITLNK